MQLDRSVAAEILERIAEGEPLRAILRSDPERFPGKSQWYVWLADDKALAAAFEVARLDGADAIAQRARETARGAGDSTGDVQRDKLIIDTDLKLLAKWFPQPYGDRVSHEHSAPGGGPVEVITRIEVVGVEPRQE